MSFALRPDVRYRVLLNEAVVIRQDAAEVLGLNWVGARVLELIDQGLTESETRDRLAQEFDVAPDRLQADVQTFIAELIELGVVESLPPGD
jgi:Coenzyme PQQ synthesis protein D (PqqD)